MIDKLSNAELNIRQLELGRLLNFSEDALYHPEDGDVILTIDIHYNKPTAFIGCDMSLYKKGSVNIFSSTKIVEGEYIPGYFSFYEGPPIISFLKDLAEENIHPKLIIVDGHGLAHPRKFGLACYVGAMTNLPCIGIAKESLLPFVHDGKNSKGGRIPVFLDKEQVGAALITQDNVKPVYISAGNKIDLETSIIIIQSFVSEYRIPDNIRRADQASRNHS